MATKQDILEQTKKLLNSILCGHKNGATAGEVARDYNEFEYKDLPTRELGFPNVTVMLKSMPDVIEWTEVDGQAIFRAVVNEKNARIVNLVARQKSKTKLNPRKRASAARFMFPSSRFVSRQAVAPRFRFGSGRLSHATARPLMGATAAVHASKTQTSGSSINGIPTAVRYKILTMMNSYVNGKFIVLFF